MHNLKFKIMAQIRINEAIAKATLDGKKVKKMEIAARLWPDSVLLARRANMTNLCTGKTDRITKEMVEIICEMTGCDANFLFNIKNEES